MTVQAGGPFYQVELGRFDGLVSRASDVNGRLPQPNFNLNQLNSLFASHGLTQTDMIALSGNFPLKKLNFEAFEVHAHANTA